MPPWTPGYSSEPQFDTQFTNEILNVNKWLELASEVHQPVPCQVVKAIMTQNDEIYFINTRWEKHHYNFANTRFTQMSLEQFNDVVYSGKDRSLVCPTIVKYGKLYSRGEAFPWTFEIVATDPLEADSNCARIALAFEKIQAAFKFEKLVIRPTSPAQMKNLSNPNHPLHHLPRMADPYVVWQGKTFSNLVNGFRRGILKIVSDANNPRELEVLTANDIVFFRSGIPNDLPSIACAIFAEPLPPLCHISLLCLNRRTPCCFDTTKLTANTFESYKHGSPISVDVGPSGLTISQSVVKTFNWNKSPNVPVQEPDRTVIMPFRFSGKTVADLPPISQVGAKARQCGILNIIAGQQDFESKSFVIPMGAYLHHVSKKADTFHGCVSDLNKRLARFKSLPTVADVKKDLETIRGLIMGTEVDKPLLDAVNAMLKQCDSQKVILRSSTNSEDLKGFNGAGLYTSVPLTLTNMSEKDLELAIKTVWASVWLPHAYLERLNFGIDSEKVAMCILVQPFYGKYDLAANGVAVSNNPYDEAKRGVFVTTLPGGEHRATDSVKQFQPEQTMIHMSRVKGLFEAELISPARGPSIDSTKSVCDFRLLEQLGSSVAKIHSALLGKDILDRYMDGAIDVEWLLLKESNQILIIQARPCPLNVKF